MLVHKQPIFSYSTLSALNEIPCAPLCKGTNVLANQTTLLAAENGVGVARDGVRVFHMRVPIGNIQPFVMRRPHVAVGRDLVLISAL